MFKLIADACCRDAYMNMITPTPRRRHSAFQGFINQYYHSILDKVHEEQRVIYCCSFPGYGIYSTADS